MNILVLNGPNLNMLGTREPQIYGSETLGDVIEGLRSDFPICNILHLQSNHEGVLIDRIQQTLTEDVKGIIINAGALTHYSYALADALAMVKIPKVEVHISHIFAREAFRHVSVISPSCHGMISGMGTAGYGLAVKWLLDRYS
ncbi:MAG: type II 3-dehydroquinate dehydratase [Bacteroidia bacterium]|nr:type II 3-dehydroquinate dehydratase [Bacteroidia bacterium]